MSCWVSKNGLFEPFVYKNEHFAKTGSGQGKLLQKEDRFSSGGGLDAAGLMDLPPPDTVRKENLFVLRHIIE